MTRIVAHYKFGTAGNVRPYLKEGWSLVERDFTWTVGPRSAMALPLTGVQGVLILEIYLNPMLMPPVIRQQRVVISVNGHAIADEFVGGESALAFEIPAATYAGEASLKVDVCCPDAVAPVAIGAGDDDRRLGVAVREIMLFDGPARPSFTPRFRPPLPDVPGGVDQAVAGLTALTLPDLAGRFESLGHNCEFGLVQRRMNHEGLGLLRFGGIPVHKLIEGLDLDFEGIEAPDNLMAYLADTAIDVSENEREFLVYDRRYGTNFHTHLTKYKSTPGEIVAMFTRNLAFLRRKMLEDIASGHKIFVFQHPSAKTVAHIRPILNVLRSHGPNTLLFLTDDGPHAPGSVEQIDDDLYHGFVTQLAPVYDAKRYDYPGWISVLANTYRLWRESGRGDG